MRRWYLPPVLNRKLNSLLREINNKRVPTKLWRRLWHLAGGLFFPVLALFVSKEVLLITIGTITGVFVFWEVIRFIYPNVNRWTTSHLGTVLKREEEFQPTGTTSLLMASLVVFFLFEKDVAITSLLFVAIGDLAAAIIGEKYGKHMVLKKTMEGSLACLVSCLLIGLLVAGLSNTVNISMIIYGAFCAAVVEVLPIPVDDNFTIPLFSAGFMALVALYSG